jgi:putative Mg2+ transporter-C (MgtC) family protein
LALIEFLCLNFLAMHQLDNLDAIFRIFFAILCGGAVGWERERREKSAGLRTHIFVAMASALIMIVSTYGFSHALAVGLVTLDPSRIAAQAVSGISFLGAGVIWFNRNKVRGLDTAAGIWTTSAMGLAAGAGMFLPAFFVMFVVLAMNICLTPIEKKLFPRHVDVHFLILLSDLVPDVEEIRRAVEEGAVKIIGIRMVRDKEAASLGIDVKGPAGTNWLAVVARLQKLSSVSSVSMSQSGQDSSEKNGD